MGYRVKNYCAGWILRTRQVLTASCLCLIEPVKPLWYTTIDLFIPKIQLKHHPSPKATRCDNIGPNILKFCSSALANPLLKGCFLCIWINT